MKSGKRIWFWTLSLLGAALLIIPAILLLASSYINSGKVKAHVQSYVAERTGGSVDYRKAELVPYPLPHILMRHTRFSIPGKAIAVAESVELYLDVWTLLRGKVSFSGLRVGSPRVLINLSEAARETSLDEMECKIKSFLNALTSSSPEASITVQEGKFEVTKNNITVLSLERVRTKIKTSGSSVNISLTCASDLWRTLFFESAIQADTLESEGSVKASGIRPHVFFARLFPKIGRHIGDSGIDFSARFRTVGLRQVRAAAESSADLLVFIRNERTVKMNNVHIKGDIEIDPESLAVVVKKVMTGRPGLKISGTYSLDRTSGIMNLDLHGQSNDVQSVRRAALTLGGDAPAVKNIFDVLRGGNIPSLRFNSDGKSLRDLGRLSNMNISGRIIGGEIYVRARDLYFHNVTGDAAISKGILEGSNIRASLEGQSGSKGKLRIGLKGKDAPFTLDIFVRSDLDRLPSFLTTKRLIRNKTILNEIARLSDTQGFAEGRLVLGDRLNALHVIAYVSQMKLAARYDRLPFPLLINGGRVFFNEKRIEANGLNAVLGASSVADLAARINIERKADAEINTGRMTISADEMYPWLTSFKKIRSALRDISAMKGSILVSSLSLKGPLSRPEEWRYLVNGRLHRLTLDSTLFPGKAEMTNGTFTLNHDELSVKEVRTGMPDSSFTISGKVAKFPAGIRNIDLSIRGEAGPDVAAWISKLVHLPPDISVRAPVKLQDSRVTWEEKTKTTFDGRLIFDGQTEVSLKLAKTPHEFLVRELSIHGGKSDAVISLKLREDLFEIGFKGMLTASALNTIFAKSRFADAALQGDLKGRFFLKDPFQSVAEGTISAKNIPVPWKYGNPLLIETLQLTAHGKSILLDPGRFLIGQQLFIAKGTMDASPKWFILDMDVYSNGFDWETIGAMVGGHGKKEDVPEAGFLRAIPLRGMLRLQSDFFLYRNLAWKPFDADLSFDGERLQISSRRASVCGISTTGDAAVTAEGIELDIALYAKDLELRPAILCISNKNVDITGRFQIDAHLKAKGKPDTIVDSLSGSFKVTAKKGKIFKSQSLDKTLDLVNKTENIKGKLPDLDRTAIDYRLFTAGGTVKGHMLQLEEGVLETSVFGILAQGTINLQSLTLDLNALVAPFSIGRRIVSKIPVIGYILGGNLVSLPVKIKGSLSDPQVDFASPSAIGSALLGIMERTIKLPIKIIEPILPSQQPQK